MQKSTPRVFKTAWFAKKAKAAGIADAELCKTARELIAGQGDDLGGNVWKKRLDRNTKRGIVVTKVGDFWVFVYLFAKSDRENIDERELRDFKKLARDYGKARHADIDRMLESKDLAEICNG
ncbi:addiction module toxin RelE (plasmid) [Burkholderia sp. THE68]|uniref:type II toxin-antitoxin system RelE/ParE family toxin n=1 Tax=Burkholderia sp. THE68 TaxID=758782 RepID=UPI0013191714|nr:type II toxin-antitoxin system RelE/ParE family toxin [Burkholderia sp. THE68]BBU32429.1 addiction module toxin RelE [Burkholderia sp. THE68]